VLRQHVVDVLPSRDGELDTGSDPMQGRTAGAEQAHHPECLARRPRFVVELRCLQCDVVAEPLRLLVGVGVAAHVHQQCAVVHRGASFVAESDPFSDPKRDEALP
jgi:hypothetical protein